MKLSLGVVLVLVGGVAVACSSSDATTTNSTTPPSSNGTPDAGPVGTSPTDAGPSGPVACAAPPCADGDVCVKSADCTSNICTANKCIPISCTDRIKNADETDVDCGGSCATKCGPTKSCAADADCSDGTCTDTKCVIPTSADGKANGNETDADCGSSRQGGVTDTKAPACDAGKKCLADVDCKSGGCNFAGVCAFARSCVSEHGGTTCGAGDFTSDAKQHEDCCASAVVENYAATAPDNYANPVGAAYRLDKFQITAGRIRTFLDAVKGDVQTWVKTNRTKLDPYARAELPATIEPYLPKGWTQPASTDDCNDGGGGPSYKCNYGALNQISGYRYNDGPGGTYGYGCYMGPGQAGSRTSYLSAAELTALDDGEGGHLVPKDRLDEKAVDCVTYPIVAAFCAWDGGHLETLDEYRGAFGGDGDAAGRRYPYASNDALVGNIHPTRSLGLNDFYGTILSPLDNYAYTPADPPAGTDRYSIYNYNLTAAQKTIVLARLTRANHFWNYFDTIINDQIAWLQGRAEAPIAAEQVETLDDQSVAVAPPGRYPSGAGKYGHRDLTGNVMEITGTIGYGPSTYVTGTGVRWTANGSFEGGAHTASDSMRGYSGFTFQMLTKYGRTGARCARPSGVYPVSVTPKGN